MFTRSAFRAARAAPPRSAFQATRTAQTFQQQQARSFTSADGGKTRKNTALKVLIGLGAGALAYGFYGFVYLGVTGYVPFIDRERQDAVFKDMPGRDGEYKEYFKRQGTSTEGMKHFLKGGDQGWVPVKLQSVEEVNHNTKMLRFVLPDPEMVSGVYSTSCILTKIQKPGEKPVIRPYTPISKNNEQGHIDLLVKKYEGGPMSTHLHSLAPGDELLVKGPMPKYWWDSNKHSHIALVAGGTGITPMWQLINDVMTDPKSRTAVTVVYANVKEEDVLLKQHLQALENFFPRKFRVFYFLDDPPEGWQGGKGYVSKEILKEVLPEPSRNNFKVFVCGPPGMVKAICGPKKSPKDQGELGGILKELGYNEDDVYKF